MCFLLDMKVWFPVAQIIGKLCVPHAVDQTTCVCQQKQRIGTVLFSLIAQACTERLHAYACWGQCCCKLLLRCTKVTANGMKEQISKSCCTLKLTLVTEMCSCRRLCPGLSQSCSQPSQCGITKAGIAWYTQATQLHEAMQVIRALAGQAIAFADDWDMTTLETSHVMKLSSVCCCCTLQGSSYLILT